MRLFGLLLVFATGNIITTIATTESSRTKPDGDSPIPRHTVTSDITATSPIIRLIPRADNTQACNNYVEFCNRSYGNITEICAHNSPFHIRGDVFSNQDYDVFTQLNDGIRMLEGQTHMLNGTLHYCHTSCDFLDAGPAESFYSNISQWLSNNPNEVVTILIANSDNTPVSNFAAPIQNSGLGKYVYTPPHIPMNVSSWPTLGDMISRNTRVVIFMDYEADQTKVPYILDQYSQLWQTPFSPTNASFPCTILSPPDITEAEAKNRMYLANHNLNSILNIGNSQVLIPDTNDLNRTNGVSGYGSLGLASENCANTWGRPPNFLVVDYYSYGSPFEGSVFEVAAQANGVAYSRSCCGMNQTATSAVGSGISRASETATITSMAMATMSSTTNAARSNSFLLNGRCIGLLVLALAAAG